MNHVTNVITDPGGGVEYAPFISTDGRVGYKIRVIETGEEGFIYMNPSCNSVEAPDEANVFVYTGTENDLCEDTPEVWIASDPRTMTKEDA